MPPPRHLRDTLLFFLPADMIAFSPSFHAMLPLCDIVDVFSLLCFTRDALCCRRHTRCHAVDIRAARATMLLFIFTVYR